MKRYKVREVLDILKKDGWTIVGQKGSHRQLKNSKKKGKVTVNGKPSDDTWGAELSSIEKQSGLIF